MPDPPESHSGSSPSSPVRRSSEPPPEDVGVGDHPPHILPQGTQEPEFQTLNEEEESLMALLLANPGPSLDRVEKIKRRLTTVRRLLKKQEEAEREKSELQKKVLQMQLAMKEQEAEHNAELSNLYNSTGELQNMELKVLQLGKEKALRMLAVKQGIRERMSNSGALPQSTSSDRTPTSQLSAAAQAAGVQLPDEVMAALEAGMAKLNLQRQGAPAQPHDPPFQAFSFHYEF